MADMNEMRYEIKESIIKEIYNLCCDIISTKVDYRKNQLDMANTVISSNSLNASTIKSIFDEIINDSLTK